MLVKELALPRAAPRHHATSCRSTSSLNLFRMAACISHNLLVRRRFAFDPVTKEAYSEGQLDGSFKNPVKGAWYWYRLAGNIVWLVLVGWALALGHLMAAIVSVRLLLGIWGAWAFVLVPHAAGIDSQGGSCTASSAHFACNGGKASGTTLLEFRHKCTCTLTACMHACDACTHSAPALA